MLNFFFRSIASTCTLQSDSEKDEKASWMKRMLRIRTVDPGTQSHSQALGDKDTVYELQSRLFSKSTRLTNQ